MAKARHNSTLSPPSSPIRETSDKTGDFQFSQV